MSKLFRRHRKKHLTRPKNPWTLCVPHVVQSIPITIPLIPLLLALEIAMGAWTWEAPVQIRPEDVRTRFPVSLLTCTTPTPKTTRVVLEVSAPMQALLISRLPPMRQRRTLWKVAQRRVTTEAHQLLPKRPLVRKLDPGPLPTQVLAAAFELFRSLRSSLPQLVHNHLVPTKNHRAIPRPRVITRAELKRNVVTLDDRVQRAEMTLGLSQYLQPLSFAFALVIKRQLHWAFLPRVPPYHRLQ